MEDFFISFSPRPHRASEIPWLPYERALDEAERSDRLVLLVTSASWCHWCHILDETTFSDDAVIETVRSRFVATRLDADRHPDLDVRYNQGGWPSVAILSPQGVTLTGGTFLGARELLQLLGQAEAYYRGSKDEFLEKVREFEAEIDRFVSEPVALGDIAPRDVVDRCVDLCLAAYDTESPGFGEAPRFPHADALRLIALESVAQDDAELASIVEAVLTAMVEGDLVDWVEGGFFRYCDHADWTRPHTEKRLVDNAVLIELFSDMSRLVQDSRLAARLREVATLAGEYLATTLALPGGGFASCQDADDRYYGMTVYERERAMAPPIDREFFASYNARAAAALASLARATGDDRFRALAREALGALERDCLSGSALPRRWPSASEHPLHLSDAASYLYALVSVDDRGEPAGRARAVADSLIETFYAEPKKSFLDRTHRPDDRGPARIPFAPIDENALAARALLRLYRHAGDDRYVSVARDTILGFEPVLDEYGVGSASVGVAALELALLEREA